MRARRRRGYSRLGLGACRAGGWLSALTPALAQVTSGLGRAWRGRIDESACSANFLETSEIFDGKARLNACCSTALIDGDDVCRSDRRGLSLGAGSTPGYICPGGDSAQRVREGGKVNCCVLPPRWLDRPTTPRGEAGERGRGVEAWPTLARCDPSTPRWGEG